jgi:hypothetical protein
MHAYADVNLGLLIWALLMSYCSKSGSSILKYSQNSVRAALDRGELERAYLLALENRVRSHVIHR